MSEQEYFEWLIRAKSNLARADKKRKPENVLYEDLCYDCQQCVEKSLKALLIYKNIEFPKTHSINYLIDVLESNGIIIPEYVKESVILTDYAVETRYPGNYEPVKGKNLLKL